MSAQNHLLNSTKLNYECHTDEHDKENYCDAQYGFAKSINNNDYNIYEKCSPI